MWRKKIWFSHKVFSLCSKLRIQLFLLRDVFSLISNPQVVLNLAKVRCPKTWRLACMSSNLLYQHHRCSWSTWPSKYGHICDIQCHFHQDHDEIRYQSSISLLCSIFFDSWASCTRPKLSTRAFYRSQISCLRLAIQIKQKTHPLTLFVKLLCCTFQRLFETCVHVCTCVSQVMDLCVSSCAWVCARLSSPIFCPSNIKDSGRKLYWKHITNNLLIFQHFEVAVF